jgi:hypothetical protein
LTSQAYRAATDASRTHLVAAPRPSTMTAFAASSSPAAALVPADGIAGRRDSDHAPLTPPRKSCQLRHRAGLHGVPGEIEPLEAVDRLLDKRRLVAHDAERAQRERLDVRARLEQ